MQEQKLILLTNDDGYLAKGIQKLIELLRETAHIVVVAPDGARSGKSHAITLGEALFLKKLEDTPNFQLYSCSGTPADCVKIALHSVLDRLPDLVISGINHGSNAAVNAIYSGTVGAATEGAFHNVPSLALSLTDHGEDADFSGSLVYAKRIIDKVLETGMPMGVSLNVNVPNVPVENIQGIRVCKMTPGRWVEEFEHRKSPHGQDYYWLTGKFINYEPENEETDEWALAHNYVTIVPIHNDLTHYKSINKLKHLEY